MNQEALDSLDEMAEAMAAVPKAISKLSPPSVTVNVPPVKAPNVEVHPPTVNVHPPTVNIQPASVNVTTKAQSWKFKITKRDHNDKIEEWTATPIT